MTVAAETPEQIVDGLLATIAKMHKAHEVQAAEKIARGLRLARPDEDPVRLHDAADWVAETSVHASNAMTRELLRPRLLEAASLPSRSARQREVGWLIAEESARLREAVGVVWLQPALDVLEAAYGQDATKQRATT